LDSNIYSYYAKIIAEKYEERIAEKNISECVTAYRRIKLNPKTKDSRNKCNIDFANDIFKHIRSYDGDLVAITFDISSFFDNLNHLWLKKAWREVIQSGKDLPKDHYNIYRNITKFSYIEDKELFREFKDEILVERIIGVRPAKISKFKFLRNRKAIAYCEKNGIQRLRNKNYIKTNKYEYNEKDGITGLRKKGVPQGSPISAVLANIYMLEFDTSANNFLNELQGIYRRYSDDMVVICKIEHEMRVIEFFTKQIAKYELEIKKEKTQVFHFKYDNKRKRHFCSEKNLSTSKSNFEYLGFQFDGYHILLKSSSLAGFYRKMKRSFRRALYYASHGKTETKGEIFKSRLYKKFTYRGAKRRRKYIRDKVHSDRFYISKKYDWGNYITYAMLAKNTLHNNKIGNQIKKHWKIFHELLNKCIN
jgi:hypothetical protein